MQEKYVTDETFDRIDSLEKGEYENCTFNNCDFSDSDLSEYKFSDCVFKGCNLSLAKLNKTALRDVKFSTCKMLGIRFDACHELGLSVTFESCQLNHSSFYQTKIKRTVFRNCQLHEVDFAETDLTSSVFDDCDLARAAFDHTILEKADLRTSYNYSINPEMNRIRKARFSLSGITGLLDKYDIEIEG